MPDRSELSQHRFGDAGRRGDRRSLHPAPDQEALVVCGDRAHSVSARVEKVDFSSRLPLIARVLSTAPPQGL